LTLSEVSGSGRKRALENDPLKKDVDIPERVDYIRELQREKNEQISLTKLNKELIFKFCRETKLLFEN
jgi:hypothetical protein